MLVTLMRLTRTLYFLRMPDNKSSHTLGQRTTRYLGSSPSLWPGVQLREGHMLEWWGGRPVTKSVCCISKTNPGDPWGGWYPNTHADLSEAESLPRLPPCLPLSVGPRMRPCLSILLFLTTSLSISAVPRLSHVNPCDLLTRPPNSGFCLVWKTVFQFSKWLPIGKMLACLLPG